MKMHEITSEMAHAGTDYTHWADRYAANNKKIWYNNGQDIADMDNYTIRKYNDAYSVWDNTKLVACASILTGEIPVVDSVWVNSEYRGQRMFEKLLWFFLTRLNYSQLLLGESHSELMRKAIENLKIAPRFWYNTKTKEVVPYEAGSTDKYYELPFDEWMLMIAENGFKNWPMRNGKGFTKESYEGNVF